ncbi:MAG: hypothetical protein JWN86_1828 [Planctomycetota bacterium]|nr:hypothetical protein [Planctomycetota bacterium]
MTSGLLNLYAGRPEELKCVVGHELGHVKCGRLELKSKAFGVPSAARAIDVAVVPDKYQAVLPNQGPGGRIGDRCGVGLLRSRELRRDGYGRETARGSGAVADCVAGPDARG